MTVEKMIAYLSKYPKDMQVRDTFGSPIYWVAKKPERKPLGFSEGVYLEPVSQMDIKEELSRFFEYCEENNIDENDAFLTLGENGLTLQDFEGTQFYERAVEHSKTHSW